MAPRLRGSRQVCFCYGRTLMALQAFQLTNETFGRGPNDRWRIFQVIFLVSQIPGIVALTKPTPEGVAERNCVDIIYFPTGGGKTEAYLVDRHPSNEG